MSNNYYTKQRVLLGHLNLALDFATAKPNTKLSGLHKRILLA